MATNATDVVSIDELKRALRLDHLDSSLGASDPSLSTAISELDDYLENIIEQAVDFVVKDTGMPLIDYNQSLWAPFPENNDDPIVVDITEFPDWKFDPTISGTSIRYYTDGSNPNNNVVGSLVEPPNQSYFASGFSSGAGSRIVYNEKCVLIYAGIIQTRPGYHEHAWPTDVLEDTNAQITGTIKIDDVPKGIKACVIEAARDFDRGDGKISPAYNRVVWNYRRVAVDV